MMMKQKKEAFETYFQEDGFSDVKFLNEMNKSLYFSAIDEETKENITLETTYTGEEIIVNMRSNNENKWYYLMTIENQGGN
jgi:hypothetical protein